MEKTTTPKRSRGRGRGRGKGRGSAKQTPEKEEPVKIEDTVMETEAEAAPKEIAEVSKDDEEATELTDEQLLQDNEVIGQDDEQFEDGYEGMDGAEESYEQFGEEEFYDEAEENENDEATEETEETAADDEEQLQEEEKAESGDKDGKTNTADEKHEEKKDKRETKSKSKEPVKRRGFPPKPKHSSHLDISQMIKFVRAEWGYCTVYVGPLQVEDLATEVIKKATHAARWSAFRYFRKLDNEQFGTLELRFRSRDEADVCTKEMDAVEGKPYVIKNFKQLKEDNSKIPYFLSVVDMEDWGSANRNMLYSQLENVGINSDSVWVYIENIPEDMSETDLRQELENCAEVVFPRDADGKPQGFCYAHMSDISTRAEFTAKSKNEESVTIRGQPLHVYRLIQGYGIDRFKRTMPSVGGPMMKRPRPDSYGSGHSGGYGSGYRGAKPYEGRIASRGQGRYSPPGRGRFRGVSTGYRNTRGGYGAGAGFRDSREEGGVHKLLSGLEKILERHERDDRPRGGGGEFSRDFANAGRYGDSGGYGRREFGSSDKYQNTRFSRDSYASGGGSIGRPHRGHDSGSRYGSRDDFRRGSSPNRGYGGGYSGRYSPHRSYGSGIGSSRLPFGSGGSSSWGGGGYMGN